MLLSECIFGAFYHIEIPVLGLYLLAANLTETRKKMLGMNYRPRYGTRVVSNERRHTGH